MTCVWFFFKIFVSPVSSVIADLEINDDKE